MKKPVCPLSQVTNSSDEVDLVDRAPHFSLKCGADVSERRAARQNDLPIGAGSGEERAVEFRPGECATSQGDDSPSPLRHVPEIEGLAQTRLQSEDLRKARFGESLTLHALTPDWCRSASWCSALQPHHLAITRTLIGSFGC